MLSEGVGRVFGGINISTFHLIQRNARCLHEAHNLISFSDSCPSLCGCRRSDPQELRVGRAAGLKAPPGIRAA
jgi:hypothetical protein